VEEQATEVRLSKKGIGCGVEEKATEVRLSKKGIGRLSDVRRHIGYLHLTLSPEYVNIPGIRIRDI
jgi:hypothetical protein